MSPLLQSPGFWISAGAGLVLVGGLLILLGRYPRRTGTTPYCRRCGYALIGNDSGRCSECGQTLSFRGERRVRPRVAWAGLLLVVLGILPLGIIAYGRASGTDLYHHVPMTLVVRDAASGNADVVDRAWVEIERRRALGPLPEASRQTLVDLALSEQANPPPARETVRRVRVLNFLAAQFDAGTLSAEQSNRYLAQIFRIACVVRPRFGVGDPMVFEVRPLLELPPAHAAWAVKWEQISRDVDDVAQQNLFADAPKWLDQNEGTTLSTTWLPPQPALAPGPRVLKVKWRYELFDSRPLRLSGPPRRPYSGEIKWQAPLEVVRDGASLIKVVPRPDLAESIRNSIVIKRIGRPPPYSQPMVDFAVENAPTNLALEVVMRADGVERRIDPFSIRRGETQRFVLDGYTSKPLTAEKVDLIFRTSVEAAKRSLDLYEVWGGEIVFPDMPADYGR